MKVCLISNRLPPEARGGAEQVVWQSACGLRAAGHEVSVIALSAQPARCETIEGVTIYWVNSPNVFFYTEASQHNWWVRLLWQMISLFNVVSAHRIKKILQTLQPEVVHTHNIMGLSFLLPRVIRRLGLKHVHTVHDVQLLEPSGILGQAHLSPINKAYTAITRYLFASPEMVIFGSEFLKQWYSEQSFFSKSQRVSVHNPLTVPVRVTTAPAEFTFVFVGQLEIHKGILDLIAAFKQTTIAARLQIIGTGTLWDQVLTETSTDTRIQVLGAKDHAEIGEYLAKASVVVVPSRCLENAPTVIAESLATMVPVLASDAPGVAEYIQAGVNGELFKAGDVSDLLKQLVWCAEHQSQVTAWRAQTHASVADFNVTAHCEQLVTLYQTIV